MTKHHSRVSPIRAAAILFLGACASATIHAADMGMEMQKGTVMIAAPKDGAKLSAAGENKLDYAITLGQGDDHFHVWIDEEKSPAQRDLNGSYILPKMAPGKHVISVKVVDKAHVPTGPEQTVSVLVE